MAWDGLTLGVWLALALGAGLVGFAKTAVGGVSLISVAIFAAVLPAKQSTGALLPLLLVGDVYAVRAYHHHADWAALRRLAPAVTVGIVLGAVFLSRVDDLLLRRTIGGILLVLVVLQVVTRKGSPGSRSISADQPGSGGRLLTVAAGCLAGFTSMVANAGGATMSLYMLRIGMGMMAFLGTGAWFFLAVNAAKVPFSIGLGLISTQALVMALVLAPLVVMGGWIGRRFVARLSFSAFEFMVLAFTAVAALNLLR